MHHKRRYPAPCESQPRTKQFAPRIATPLSWTKKCNYDYHRVQDFIYTDTTKAIRYVAYSTTVLNSLHSGKRKTATTRVQEARALQAPCEGIESGGIEATWMPMVCKRLVGGELVSIDGRLSSIHDNLGLGSEGVNM